MERIKKIYNESILYGVLQDTDESMSSVVRWLRNFYGQWGRRFAHPKIYVVAFKIVNLKSAALIGETMELRLLLLKEQSIRYLNSLTVIYAEQ